MVQSREIINTAAWSQFAAQVIESAGVLDDERASKLYSALCGVSRAAFVVPEQSQNVIQDVPVEIPYKQVTLRPTLLVKMLGYLDLNKGDRALVLGSGSGYSAALIASCGPQTYALEKVGLLAQYSRKLLDNLGFQNVLVRSGDAVEGWSTYAPYENILQCYPGTEVSARIAAQLAEGGRLLLPLIQQTETSNDLVLTAFDKIDGELREVKLARV